MAVTMTTGNTVLAGLLPKDGTARLVANILAVVAGSLLLWVASKTHVPFYPVPMNLATLAVLLIGACYGSKLGLATVLLYLAQGAIGLPVFSGTPERGIGLAYLLGPTGGYLFAYAVAAFVVGWLVERGAGRSFLRMLPVTLLGSALVLALGFAWLATLIGPEAAIASGVAPFLLGDLIKSIIVALAIPAGMVALARR